MKNSPIYSILYVFVLCAIAATLLTMPVRKAVAKAVQH